MTHTKLTEKQQLISANRTPLPNGQTMVTEVIELETDQFIVASILEDDSGAAISSTYCGTCSGLSVGCVDCPHNDPVLDCINRRIYCAS